MPREASSGQSRWQGGVTKAGNAHLHWLISERRSIPGSAAMEAMPGGNPPDSMWNRHHSTYRNRFVLSKT